MGHREITVHDIAAQFNPQFKEFARTAPGGGDGLLHVFVPHATAGAAVMARAGSDAGLLAYEEFLTVICCAPGKLCSSRTLSTCMCARTVCPGARARNLVREATSRPASRRCCARRARSRAGRICRPRSARPSASSPRSARRRCRPPSHRSFKRGNIDAWQMRAPAWSCRPDTAATHPGRAVLRSRQVLAAECAWSRAGARAGGGFGA